MGPSTSSGVTSSFFADGPTVVVILATAPYTTAARRFSRPASYSEIQAALNTLKVDISAKDAPLKKAYLDLVRTNHPDKPGGSEAKMKEITTSYNLLKSLSELDRKSYRSSKSSYGPGAHQQADQAGKQRATSYNNPHDAHDAYRKKYEQQQRGYYKYDPRTGNYNNAYSDRMASNPWGAGPFPQAGRELRHLPLASLLFRALMIYTAVSIVFLIVYRQYKDYTHDDGWAASQATWRNERIDQLNNLRNEARQRVRDREEGALEPRRRQDVVTGREQRALDYARRREQEMQSADHGAFPRLNPEGLEGLIMRDYNDPAGIAYYVPPLPNGAPPFSGNGRFMYSTGSIPRHQCVPTPVEPPAASAMRRQAPPRNGTLAPTRSVGGGRGGPSDGMTLGDLGRPLSEQPYGQGPTGMLASARPAPPRHQADMVHEIRESDMYAQGPRYGDNAVAAGHTAPVSRSTIKAPTDTSSAPHATSSKPGFYGDQTLVDGPGRRTISDAGAARVPADASDDQPLNMRRRPYTPPSSPSSAGGGGDNATRNDSSPAPGLVP